MALYFLAGVLSVSASPWTRVPGSVIPQSGESFDKFGSHFQLDLDRLRDALTVGSLIKLPHYNGTMHTFRMTADITHNTMHPKLAAKFPSIKIFHGRSEAPTGMQMTVDLSLTEHGLHAMIWCPAGGISYIDPHNILRKNGMYVAYSKRENMDRFPNTFKFIHSKEHDHDKGVHLESLISTIYGPNNDNKRTYTAAFAANKEYCDYHGGTVSGCLAGVTAAVARVNGIYKREISVELQLHPQNDKLMCTSCPASGTLGTALSNGGDIIGQTFAFINSKLNGNILNNAGYDIGHGFNTAGGGSASRGGVCTQNKAAAYTGSNPPTNDAFWVDFVAHEVGHQFDAPHTFNGESGNCNAANWASSDSIEIGSATTIMGYAGICASDNVQQHSDPMFSVASLSRMQDFVQSGTGTNCGAVTSSGNTRPSVQAETATMNIPKNQPFMLGISNSSAGAESDQLTYSWEQIDIGSAQAPLSTPTGTNQPRFRTYLPTVSSTRYFPKMSTLAAGESEAWEQLPTEAGTMNFAVIVRDHFNPSTDHGFGLWNYDRTQVNVLASGPLVITSPASTTVWRQNAAQTVTWNVAGTSAASSTVKVLMSVDGGKNFPYELSASTSNSGSVSVVSPCVGPSANHEAMIMVRSTTHTNSGWFALSSKFSLSGSSACTPSTTPPPTNSQPIAGGTPHPTQQVGPPTPAPTHAPTPQSSLRIEFTIRAPSMSYATNAVGGSGEATLLQNIRTKVKAAVSPSYSPIADADTVLRTVQRITSSVDTGILIQAHTAFDTTGTDGRTAGIAFSNALKAQTVFSGWYGGAQTTQNVTVDEIAAPAEFCAKEKCHYVAWEAFHNTAKQMKVYALENEQVIFFWAGDEAVYKVADEEKWNACDMAGATRITTDTDEQNGYFGYVTPSTEGKIYLVAGETGLSIGTTSSAEMCKEGLKATIFVNEIRPKKSGGLGEGSVIMITLGFMVFCTGIFLLWWFCRTEDEHRNVHAADNMAKSSMKLAQLGSPTMQNISAARSPNKARPSFAEAKRRSNQKQAAGGGKRRASMALPPGWTYHFSDDGSIYYYNENTKKSQWTCPAVAL